MKKALVAFGVLIFLFPSVSSAAGITYQQASSIIVLLEAFGVNSSTIATVWADIQPADTPLSPPTVATTQDTSPQYQPEFGGIAPVVQQTQIVPPIVAPTPVLTSLSASNGNPSTIYGGNCYSVSYLVSAFDQSGNLMSGVPIYFFNPDTNKAITVDTSNEYGNDVARIDFEPQATSTTYNLVFASGGISTSTVVNVGPSLYEYLVARDGINNHDFIQDGSYLETNDSAQEISTSTGKCL